jgi:nucleoid DNA-binding protein
MKNPIDPKQYDKLCKEVAEEQSTTKAKVDLAITGTYSYLEHLIRTKTKKSFYIRFFGTFDFNHAREYKLIEARKKKESKEQAK